MFLFLMIIAVFLIHMKKLLFLLFIVSLSKNCLSQDGDFYNLYFAGNALLAKGQHDKAIEKYNAAIKLFSADYVFFNRGNAYYAKKDYTNALLDYSKTLKMNDGYAEAYFQRGLTKSAVGDKTGCDDLKKADKLKLDGAEAAFKKFCK
jgi:tetratricopeptide (TPR) repeat protein